MQRFMLFSCLIVLIQHDLARVEGIDESDIIPIRVVGRRPNTYDSAKLDRRRSSSRRTGRTDQSGLIDSKCLRCICYASTKCQAFGCDNSGPDSYFCGPFQASWAYWNAGGKPTIQGGLDVSDKHAFEECLKDYECSSRTVEGYMKKHQQDCDNNQVTDCYDFARIHKTGPYSCDSSSIEGQSYWNQFLECMNDEVDVSIPNTGSNTYKEIVPTRRPRPSRRSRQSSRRRAPSTRRPQSRRRPAPVESKLAGRRKTPSRRQTAVASNNLVDEKCLSCICYANTKCEPKACYNAGSAYFCGPFQGTWNFWADGGKPTVRGGLPVDHALSFEECLQDYNCSSRAVEGYMQKHQKDCNNDYVTDCYDFAKIHKAGPYGCTKTEWLERQEYWTRFLDCMDGVARFEVPYDVPAIKPSKDAQQNLPSEDRYTEESSVPDETDQTAVATSTGQAANIDDKCLRCICHASSKCVSKGCNNAGSSYLCGPFLATWLYWSEGGKPTVPGGLSVDHKHAFEECLKDYTCASETVKGYMTKHNKDCNGDNVNNCYDYATMHKAGPYGCPATWLENQSYWKQFLECMNDEIDVAAPYDVPAIKPSKDAQQNLPSEDRYTEESSVPGKTDQTAVATSTGQAANIDDKCLRCICHASSKCVSKGCNNAGSSYLCGPFLATWLYWSEGGKPTVPGGLSVDHKHAFEECLKDYTCASETVKGYMTKHNKDCNGDNVNNCYDYATMHKAGPYGCPATWLENQSYWKQFLECMNDEIDVANPGQKIEHQDTNSDGGSNRRRKPSTDDVWHPPPPAGPFEAPVTIRPVSNARLPPFAPKKDQSRNDNKREPTYSEDRPVSNYDEQQPFSGDIVRRNNKRRPPANDDRKQGNSNRRQPIPKDIVDQKCLQCLCYASSKCESLACHNAGPHSYFCGPFQATWAYWKEAGSPTVIGGRTANHKHAFEECLKDYDCAVRSVQGYMNKYQQDCNRDYSVDCYDFARLHRLGGYTCNDTKIESTDYWKQFNDCMDGFVTFE